MKYALITKAYGEHLQRISGITLNNASKYLYDEDVANKPSKF